MGPKFRWTTDFLGMNNRQNIDKISDSSSPLLVNISLDKPGVWAKRKGSALTGTTQAGNGVFGLINYAKSDGTNSLRAVRSTDLDAYTVATDTWAAIDSAQFTASTKIQSVNFKQRVYHVSTADFLCYESGGSCSEVGGGANRIKGNSIAVAQNTLFVGGITYANSGSQTWQDRVYYSLYDLANNVPGDQFWEDSETGIANSTRFFTVTTPVTGLYSYAGLVYTFTSTACYAFDLRYAENSTGVNKVFDIGLANPRAVTTVNGYMVWMSPDKRIWAWGGAGVPVNLSWAIEDDENGEALINVIDPDLSEVCAGSVGNKFYFSIGDITFRGVTYNKAVLKGLVSQTFDSVMWSLDTYPYKPIIFANTVIENQTVLCYGAKGVDDVFIMNLGTSDAGTAIQASAKTKFFDFNVPFEHKDGFRLIVKYRPQSVDNTFLGVGMAMDGDWNYVKVSDPDGTTPVIEHGVIDMYNSTSTKLDDMCSIELPMATSCKNLSFEFFNNKVNEGFEISGIGIEVISRPYTDPPKS